MPPKTQNSNQEAHASAPQQFDQCLSDITHAGMAGLTVDGTRIVDRLVSHATTSAAAAEAILNGVQLQSNPRNFFGGEAFYVAEGGLAAPHVIASDRIPTHVVAFSLSSSTKMTNEPSLHFTANNLEEVRQGIHQASVSRHSFTDTARQDGFEAIRYRSRFIGVNTHNIAIIQTPENLTPIGVFPVPEASLKEESLHTASFTHPSAFSKTTIRVIQGAGIGGAVYASYEAVKAVSNSDQPVVEAIHQSSLLATSIRGGAMGAARSLRTCAALGMAAPAAAPYVVPGCIAAGAIGGAFLAATATEVGWQVGSLAISKASPVINQSHPDNTQTSNASHEHKLQPAGDTARASPVFSGMGFFKPIDNSSIVSSCLQNIDSLKSAKADCQRQIADAVGGINVSQFHNVPRPSQPYPPGVDMQLAMINGPFMFTKLYSPAPPPSFSRGGDGFFSNGGERGGKLVCDASGCHWESGGNNCHDGNRSNCENQLFK